MEKLGAFIVALRKEKGLTQKQVAEQVGVTDKAVSKWERDLSIPDTAILMPLAEVLGVTVTELLQGHRRESTMPMEMEQVEELVSQSLELSKESEQQQWKQNRKRFLLYMLEILVAIGELFLVWYAGISLEDMSIDLGVAILLPLIFALWFFFFIKERLPAYYDKEKISYYTDGVLRLNIPGIYFNNRNWPHIVKAGRMFCGLEPVVYPLCYLLLRSVLSDSAWSMCRLAVTLTVVLGGLFIPMIVAAKKYE